MTPAGEALFVPLRAAVTAATEALFAGVPSADLAATQRVLVDVAQRANANELREP